MIHYLFITPDAFEELGRQHGAHSGLDDLRELLFPRRSEPNVLLADPHDANWISEVVARARSLPIQSRPKAFKLLEKLTASALVGWKSTAAVPNDENGWIRLVNSQVPKQVDCIFSCHAGHDSESARPVSCLADEEWVRERFSSTSKIGRCRKEQEPVLRKLLLNTDWCVAELPQVHGGNDDELATFNQLIALIRSQPDSRPFDLDLVSKTEDKKNVNWKTNVQQELSETLKGDRRISVRVYTMPTCLNRNFLSGSYQTIAGQERVRSVRWYIAAQHVALTRNRTAERNTWTLHSKSEATIYWGQLKRELDEIKPRIELP